MKILTRLGASAVVTVTLLALAGPSAVAATPPDQPATAGCAGVLLLNGARVAGQPVDPAAYSSVVASLASSTIPAAVKLGTAMGKAKTPKKQATAIKKATKVCNGKIAPQPIFTQAGQGTASTAKFRVPNDWDLAWSYDCSNFALGQGNFFVTIYDADAEGGPAVDFDNQPINKLGAADAGVERYHSGGNLKYLQVASECNWTVTITKG